MEINIKPIGIIRSSYKKPADVPYGASRTKNRGRVLVYQKFAKGLDDLDGFSHIVLVFYFHQAKGYKLRTTPYLDTVLRGIFATRSPHRPNHIGITRVKLLKRQGLELSVSGLDIIDKTPLLDIKPYVPAQGERLKSRIGWLKGKI